MLRAQGVSTYACVRPPLPPPERLPPPPPLPERFMQDIPADAHAAYAAAGACGALAALAELTCTTYAGAAHAGCTVSAGM